ncbi:MAG TPA: hypothetical protein VEZ20_08560 [Allosphingosinicella sp.]|jgi:hypothetical protein|nr:hypothetical protein [Allosphingosinicella sp.]
MADRTLSNRGDMLFDPGRPLLRALDILILLAVGAMFGHIADGFALSDFMDWSFLSGDLSGDARVALAHARVDFTRMGVYLTFACAALIAVRAGIGLALRRKERNRG